MSTIKPRGRPRTRPLNAQRLQIDWLSAEHKALLLSLGNGEMSRGVRLLCDNALEGKVTYWDGLERNAQETKESNQ